ncbi:hypothetical protein L9F63_001601, partial [Diploptera punctata]
VFPREFFPRESGKMLIPIFFRFFPRESGKMLWDVFSSSPTGGSRYSLDFSLGSREKCCFSLGSRGNVVGRFLLFSHWRNPDILQDPDILQVFPSGVGKNVVGRFLLFSHWRIPIFFRFFPRESGKMLWDVFSSSPTGGSRYSSGFSLGSRGKCCGTFSPLLPLEDPDILQVFPSGVGENVFPSGVGENVVFPSGVGENVVGRFLLFSHWRIPIFFRFSLGSRGKCFGENVDPDILQVFPSGVGENVVFPSGVFPSGVFSLGSRGKCCGTFSPLLPLEDPDILQIFPSGIFPSGGFPSGVFPSGVGENVVGRSRYSSGFPLGSGGKICGPFVLMFSTLFPLDGCRC